jgi:hypothetical protein
MATVRTKRTADFIGNCVTVATDMLKLSTRHIWPDYDKEADVCVFHAIRPLIPVSIRPPIP